MTTLFRARLKNSTIKVRIVQVVENWHSPRQYLDDFGNLWFPNELILI